MATQQVSLVLHLRQVSTHKMPWVDHHTEQFQRRPYFPHPQLLKHSNRSNLRDRVLILYSELQGTTHHSRDLMTGKAWKNRSHYIHSQEQRTVANINVLVFGSLSSLLHSLESPAWGIVSPAVCRVSHSNYHVKILPYRHTNRPMESRQSLVDTQALTS